MSRGDFSVTTSVEQAGLSSKEGDLLHHFFEREAAATPDQIALLCSDKAMTYGQLERAANRVATSLQEAGVGKGNCVGLFLPRSMEFYAAMLGILKAGAAYVPIDPVD